jgi:hypothetical protein
MSAANETRGELAITLGGEELALRPSWQAIDRFERGTGKSVVQLAGEASVGALHSGNAAIILAECIREAKRAAGDALAENYRTETIHKLMIEEPGGYLMTLKRLELLLIKAATGGYTGAGEAKAAGTTVETPAAA